MRRWPRGRQDAAIRPLRADRAARRGVYGAGLAGDPTRGWAPPSRRRCGRSRWRAGRSSSVSGRPCRRLVVRISDLRAPISDQLLHLPRPLPAVCLCWLACITARERRRATGWRRRSPDPRVPDLRRQVEVEVEVIGARRSEFGGPMRGVVGCRSVRISDLRAPISDQLLRLPRPLPAVRRCCWLACITARERRRTTGRRRRSPGPRVPDLRRQVEVDVEVEVIGGRSSEVRCGAWSVVCTFGSRRSDGWRGPSAGRSEIGTSCLVCWLASLQSSCSPLDSVCSS